MTYTFYVGKLKLPLTPGHVNVKEKNQNKTYTTLNYSEINIAKPIGLQEINFDFLIPSTMYPFASYQVSPNAVIEELSHMKTDKEPIQFIITRPGSFATNIKVLIEDLSFSQRTDEGEDYICNITLKEFKEFGTKEVKKGKPKKKRSQEKAPKPKKKPKGYTVKRGDTLWAICKKHYGKANWNLVKKIQNASNKGGVKPKISNPNLIYPGQKLVIPPA